MRDWATVFEDAGNEQPAPVRSQPGISVGHRGLLVVAELDSSTKPGGLLSSQERCHQRHGRVQLAGIGILDMETQPAPQRSIGNISAETSDFGTLVGYENHAGATTLGPEAQPLGTVAAGQGNNGKDRTEGARKWATFGTYLHGPLLPRNPLFADHLIRVALERRFGHVELPGLSHAAEQLARVSGSRRR